MRVAMMTLNVYDNYGNMLQKYALYKTLEKFADFVEVLWHPATKPFYPYHLEMEREAKGNLRDAAFRSVREYRFKQFNDANIRTRFDIPYLEEIADEYDFFVVGSDQVWNPEFKVPGRFLDFVPPKKRIAYAASIVVPELPENVQKTYRKKILEFPHVSVREKEGCDIIEKLTGKRPLHVFDPVLLLTADEWRKVAKRPPWLDKKIYKNGYLLVYFLNGALLEEIRLFAKKLGLPIINMVDKNNFEHYVTSIEEFIYLLDHATFLCTYSFHGTAFAAIFKKPFIVYRYGKLRTTRFSRVGSLLELFGLSDRVSDMNFKINLDDPMKIDFTRCNEVLPLERKKAFNFLANALWK